MTVLTTSQRLHLRKTLTAIRSEWHQAGTDAAVLELEQRLNDAEAVCLTAIRTAFNPRALLPAAMLHGGEVHATTRTVARQNGTPRPAGVTECPNHGGNTRRSADAPAYPGLHPCCLDAHLQGDTDDPPCVECARLLQGDATCDLPVGDRTRDEGDEK